LITNKNQGVFYLKNHDNDNSNLNIIQIKIMDTTFYRTSGTICAIILGIAAYRQFDFEHLKFQNLGIGIVYIIGFIISLFIVFKSTQKVE